MAAPGISFSISAVDNVTKTVNNINKSISKMTRPMTDWQKSMGRLGKALNLEAVTKSIGKMLGKAWELTKVVIKLGLALAAMVGAGSIAAVYEMVTSWARLGFELERTSAMMGISASQLNNMRAAGNLFGISTETTTASFLAFSNTLQDARWGRNQAAFSALHMLGIQLKSTKTGAIDAKDALYQVADKMKKMASTDPAAARKYAEMMGVGGMYNELSQGSVAMKAKEARADTLQGITPGMIDRAGSFGKSLAEMNLSISGMTSAIADKFIPVLKPLIKKWTEWMVANRELVSLKLGALFERIGASLQSIDLNALLNGIIAIINGMIEIITVIGKVVDAVGGWGNALKIFAGIMAISFIGSMVAAIFQVGQLITKLGILTGLMTAGELVAGIGAAATIGLPLAAAAAVVGVGSLAYNAIRAPENKLISEILTNSNNSMFGGNIDSGGGVGATSTMAYQKNSGDERKAFAAYNVDNANSANRNESLPASSGDQPPAIIHITVSPGMKVTAPSNVKVMKTGYAY